MSTGTLLEFVQEGPIHLENGSASTVVEVDELHNINRGGDPEYEFIFNFTYANGRRYFSNDPNDESQQDGLDLYHHIFLSLLGGKLYTAPLVNPQKVLDVGTGTGNWALDFAAENPQANVIGIDISPIQPSSVPENCRFEVDDMEEEWTYENKLRYIHMRSMSASFTNWSEVLKQAYARRLHWDQDYGCELFLPNGTRLMETEEHPLATYMRHVPEAVIMAGRTINSAPIAKQRLIDAGFIDVVEKTAVWPVGNWPKDESLKDIGRYGRKGVLDSLPPLKYARMEHGTNSGALPEDQSVIRPGEREGRCR
ncbi:S-adenosyl-L-methionine-dependent methyltransferase [Terfezia claveryi]|nr:S-adenosyl-L-methionine-dependent methyltransferase [Terfezia claveryi]